MDVDERIKKIILHVNDIFGPLPPPGSVKKLVTMDLELRIEFLKDCFRCRLYPASKDYMSEITRQIMECLGAGLVCEYKRTDYPKHCSPCFLVAKPGSTAKRLVVDYKKVNQKMKLHSGSLFLFFLSFALWLPAIRVGPPAQQFAAPDAKYRGNRCWMQIKN